MSTLPDHHVSRVPGLSGFDSASNRAFRQAFTLVEILVVVVILGLLAAVVVPQFTSANSDARVSSAVSQLQMVRSAIQAYCAQHNNIPPDLTTTPWGGLMSKTDVYGNISSAGVYGPYLDSLPKNPINDNSTIILINSPPTAATGWIYDNATGNITATNRSAATAVFDESNPAVR